MVETGIYNLVEEHKQTKERMYMDFEGRKDFKPIEFTTSFRVPLALIDVLTCSYQNEATFRAYLDRDNTDYQNNRDYMIYITYRNNGEKKLSCIYNDETLAHIASKTIGLKRGLVNMSDDTTRRVMFDMYEEVSNRCSSFAEEVIARNKNSYLVNVHNKDMIAELHADQPYTQRAKKSQFERFAKNFSSYKEFRALYANYREFIRRQQTFERQVSNEVRHDVPNVKTYKKENRPLPGQINIYDLLGKNQ